MYVDPWHPTDIADAPLDGTNGQLPKGHRGLLSHEAPKSLIGRGASAQKWVASNVEAIRLLNLVGESKSLINVRIKFTMRVN